MHSNNDILLCIGLQFDLNASFRAIHLDSGEMIIIRMQRSE